MQCLLLERVSMGPLLADNSLPESYPFTIKNGGLSRRLSCISATQFR